MPDFSLLLMGSFFVVSQSKQSEENSLCQLKKNLNWILPWEQTEFQSIILALPVRILERLVCLKNRCLLCVETSEMPPSREVFFWFLTRLSANLSFLDIWGPIMTDTEVMITLLTRTMLALSFLAKRSRKQFGSQSNSIEFYHRLIWNTWITKSAFDPKILLCCHGVHWSLACTNSKPRTLFAAW